MSYITEKPKSERLYKNKLTCEGDDLYINILPIDVNFYDLYKNIMLPILEEYECDLFCKMNNDVSDLCEENLILRGGRITDFDYSSSDDNYNQEKCSCVGECLCDNLTLHSFFFSVSFWYDKEIKFTFQFDLCFECKDINNYKFEVNMIDDNMETSEDIELYYNDVSDVVETFEKLFLNYSKDEVKNIFGDFDKCFQNEKDEWKFTQEMCKKLRKNIIKFPMYNALSEHSYNLHNYISVLPFDVIQLINEYL